MLPLLQITFRLDNSGFAFVFNNLSNKYHAHYALLFQIILKMKTGADVPLEEEV